MDLAEVEKLAVDPQDLLKAQGPVLTYENIKCSVPTLDSKVCVNREEMKLSDSALYNRDRPIISASSAIESIVWQVGKSLVNYFASCVSRDRGSESNQLQLETSLGRKLPQRKPKYLTAECDSVMENKSKVLILVHLVLGQAQILPKPFNLTAHITTNAPYCQEASCIVEWIQDEQAAQKGQQLLDSNCSDFESFRRSKLFIGLFSKGKVHREVIDVYYKRAFLSHCPNTCTVGNAAKMTNLMIDVQLQYAKVFSDENLLKILCGPAKNYCKWFGRSLKFTVFFGIFALPVTFILNFMNLATISKLISAHKAPAAALYFHKTEIYSDVCCSIIFYLWNNFFFFYSLDEIVRMCLPAAVSYISLYNFASAFLNLFMFVNQCTLFNMISDRCSSFKHPFSHFSNSGLTTAKKRQKRTIIISILLYTPLLFIYFFYPLFEFWKAQTGFVTVLASLYGFAPVGCVMAQISKALQYQRLYARNLKQKSTITTRSSSLTIQDLNKLRRDEKEKRLLLIGTVGLNIVASCVNMLLSVFESRFVQNFFGDPWWLNILYILSSISVFVNGTGSFIFHVILLKQYRAAFWKTDFGKAFSKVRAKFFQNDDVVQLE